MLFFEKLRQGKGTTLAEKLILLFFIFVAVFIFRISWMMLYPYKVMEPHSLMVDLPVVTAGEVVTYTFAYSKYLPVPARVIKRLENSVVIPYQDTFSNMPMGKKQFYRGEAHIPGSACPGTYRMVLDFVYYVNPLRTITVTVASDLFVVTKEEKGKKKS